VGDGARISACTVYRCGGGVTNGAGIEMQSAGRVTRCVLRENDYSGIVAGDYSYVSECVATSNRFNGMGIEIVGDYGRYQDNHLGGNRWGIGASGSSNLIMRNTLFENVQAGAVGPGNHFARPLNSPGAFDAVANPVTTENILW
jgi:hypothetical protein